ncbi:hypothetical protein [Bradyrhizobium sp. SZCCHNRI20481]|uniref:hypothetical protein n=1 Tax=Bradyrhizobium sp. SZCCHNRI20481 TaxID=3057286 RepID=UPI0029170A15|nr:hypothetical protein [Bradyrhizobium sp. SZCCHNRI20481]
MFDPLAVISLQQDTPGISHPDNRLGGTQDLAGKCRPEGDKRGLDLRAGLGRLAGHIARCLRSAHDLSYASARDPH